MNTQNVQVAVVKYLDEATLMQVVTSSGETPWVATVFFAADNQHQMYWLSPPNTRHSQEIERNDRVCGAITLPHAYGQSPQGLQFEGLAREVPREELEESFQSFAERYDAHHRLQALLDGTDVNRLYQIIPIMFVLYDEEHFPVQPRQEWRLISDDPDEPAETTDASGALIDAPAAAPQASEPVKPAPYNPLDEI